MSKNPKKPYGDIPYADPGYQADERYRLPLDSEDHIRAAWKWIAQPENQKPYSVDQVRTIQARIKASGLNHNINF